LPDSRAGRKLSKEVEQLSVLKSELDVFKAKEIDASRDVSNLRTAEYQSKVMEQMNTFILVLSRVMPQSFQAIDGQNLLNFNNT